SPHSLPDATIAPVSEGPTESSPAPAMLGSRPALSPIVPEGPTGSSPALQCWEPGGRLFPSPAGTTVGWRQIRGLAMTVALAALSLAAAACCMAQGAGTGPGGSAPA